MYFRQEITYMVIGGLFLLAGYFLAALDVGGFIPQNASSAQADGKQVVNETSHPIAVLSAIDEGGSLNIGNKIDNPAVDLMAVEESGSLDISNHWHWWCSNCLRGSVCSNG